jgi:hypothetical protein
MKQTINLDEIYFGLRTALAPLGIEVGREVLAMWRDREHHGRDALPDDALKKLAEVTARLIWEVTQRPTPPCPSRTANTAHAVPTPNARPASPAPDATRGPDSMTKQDPGAEFWTLITPHTGAINTAHHTEHGYNSHVTAVVDCESGPVFVKAVREPSPHAPSFAREAEINPYVRSVSPALRWRAHRQGWIVLAFDVVSGPYADFVPGSPDLPAIADAVNAIGAIDCPEEDVLTRRTRVSIEEWDRGVAAAPEVAALVAPILGWDEATTAQEVERYLSRVEAERASQSRDDDSTADEARRAAPDLPDLSDLSDVTAV